MTNDDLIAMVPLDKATAIKKKWPMPWPKLRTSAARLYQGTHGAGDDKELPDKTEAPAEPQLLFGRGFRDPLAEMKCFSKSPSRKASLQS